MLKYLNSARLNSERVIYGWTPFTPLIQLWNTHNIVNALKPHFEVLNFEMKLLKKERKTINESMVCKAKTDYSFSLFHFHKKQTNK